MALPKDVGYGLNGFQRMQVYSESESIARYILDILLTRPGNYPGLPHLGLNVKQYLYHDIKDFDSNMLKEQIYAQCNALMPNIISEDIFVGFVNYNGIDFLLIRIPVEVNEAKQVINYAFYQNELREIKFDFEFENIEEE